MNGTQVFAPTANPQCSTCKYFRLDPKDLKLGRCHRHPPQVTGLPANNGTIINYSDFPLVKLREFCGEYFPNLKAGI